jgi:hypothetical protein
MLLGLLVAAAALSFAACGGSDENGVPAVSQSSEQAGPVAEAEPQADAAVPETPAPEVPIADAQTLAEETPEAQAPVLDLRRAGVPVDRKTAGFEGATVEIIDFSDFQ